MEFLFSPGVTHILFEHMTFAPRRIYTDGRDWPENVEPSFMGYSIGKWIDENHDGHFTALEVETRFFRGPRALDPAGMPTHADNQSIVKERIFFDKRDPKLLHDEITLTDHALTRPWSALKTYRRSAEEPPIWREENCPGITLLTKIGPEVYFKGADGKLMPTRKGQPAPDLKYFNRTQR
jgi:hypothetical protein